MLAEFLLTPDAVCETDGRSGADVMRDLKSCLFPFSGAPVALVCELGGEEWRRAVSSRIAQLSDMEHRVMAQDLFTRITEELSVARPSVARKGEDERDWIAAGRSSSAVVPLERIVISGESGSNNRSEVALRDYVLPSFWEPYANPRSVQRVRNAQESVLRGICTHSDWLIVRMPYIRGGSDDEIVTVKQVLQLVSAVPLEFRECDVDVELHLCRVDKIPQEKLVRQVTRELQPVLRKSVRLTIKLLREKGIVNRELIGGKYKNTSSQERIRQSLWWITMAHVAIGRCRDSNESDSGNTWSLLPRAKAHARVEEIERCEPLAVRRL